MTDFQDVFLFLLRAGLWGKREDDRALNLSPENWGAIYQMAHKQAVSGIVFDGIVLLPENQLPPLELLQYWHREVLQLEMKNKQQIAAITQLEFFFNLQHQIPIRVLKGQGIAQNYRNRLHRNVGDIDLWLNSQEILEKANQLMEKEGAQVERGYGNDSEYIWMGQLIEHHYELIELNNPFFQKKLRAWEKEVFLQSKDIPTPCANLLLQITHILKHQLTGGIGIKQICDLAVSFCTLEYNKEELVALCKKYGVYRFSKLLASLVHNYLGVPSDKLPFPHTEDATLMFQEIWEGGEFGHHDTRYGNRPQGKWASKLYTFHIIWHKCKIFCFYAPSESFWRTAKLAYRRLLESLHLIEEKE